MASLRQEQIDAAQAFANATIGALQMDTGVHAETAIAATARMAGTFLFRSFGFPLKDVQPGQVVLSEQANEQGPQLIQVLGAVLEHIGVKLDHGKFGAESPEQNQPQQAFLETQRLLEPGYLDIRSKYGLSPHEAAVSAAVATALLIQQSASVLPPEVAFGLAVYGFVEGSKTAPDPVTL